MQITRLRLLGFKSFVEPTELLVERGLTGVVGPNGCGKSNLLEALRWAMGETSYKSMRGSAMEDVIFAGSQDRPSRNMAEVTLFIDNSKRTAPAEFNDADILEVTRRIEREAGSGAGEVASSSPNRACSCLRSRPSPSAALQEGSTCRSRSGGRRRLARARQESVGSTKD